MSDSPFRADGISPLTQYVQFLIKVPEQLVRLLERDVEALRILSAWPSLPEANQQTDRWHANQRRAKRTGKIIPTPRIWTRRDKRLLDNKRKQAEAKSAFFWPERRADRYLNYLSRVHPRYDLSPHDYWFRQAVEEARRDGTAAVLCLKLEYAKTTYERLVTAARHLSHDLECKTKRSEVGFACSELNKTSSDLMNWTKPAAARLVSESDINATVEAGNPAQAGDESEAPPTDSDDPIPIVKTDSGSVLLFDPHDRPIVNGTEKPTLTYAQYNVVMALLKAGDKGLTKDALDRNSGHTDARKILGRLANKDNDWKAVILLPGITGKRYRIT